MNRCFTNTRRLAIYDDTYPNLLSGFRISEYNQYLREFKNSNVFSNTPKFKEYYQEYNQLYPKFASKVLPFLDDSLVNADLVYSIFLNNIYDAQFYIQAFKKKFIFTLYPGGGFHIDQPESDYKLKTVFGSPNFIKVIVTQKITYEYLLKKNFCTKEQIEYIYAGVLPTEYFNTVMPKKNFYKQEKSTFDICFVASKYMEGGLDKGFDLFVETARSFAKKNNDFKFHVIGGFSKSDIKGSEIENIKFYGNRQLEFFPEFYASMDLILSPNRPFTLAPGAFDGFPTGSCIEAGLNKVVIFCTDELSLNEGYYKDGKEIVIIKPQLSEIIDKIRYYYDNPVQLYKIAENGYKRCNYLFSYAYQMQPRINLLKKHLNEA